MRCENIEKGYFFLSSIMHEQGHKYPRPKKIKPGLDATHI